MASVSPAPAGNARPMPTPAAAKSRPSRSRCARRKSSATKARSGRLPEPRWSKTPGPAPPKSMSSSPRQKRPTSVALTSASIFPPRCSPAAPCSLSTPRRQIEIMFNEPAGVLVRDDRRKGSYDIQVVLALATGKLAAGQPVRKSFALKVTCEVDRNPVEFCIDASRPGQIFDGLGGNFRLQNARTDPQVIQYSLDNLRIAWGRVEMPWSLWHPTEDVDP